MRFCATPITSTRSAVTYVLLARNKTRPRGFFLPGTVSSRCAGPGIAVGGVSAFLAESSHFRLATSIKRSEE